MPMMPPTFRPPWAPKLDERRREADQRRGSARSRLYSHEWDKAAKAFIAEEPVCLGCLAMGRAEPATVVDHIVPHRGDRTRFWDRANWQRACRWHHDRIKAMLEGRWQRGEIGAKDLRLDSAAAVALSRRVVGAVRGGGGLA